MKTRSAIIYSLLALMALISMSLTLAKKSFNGYTYEEKDVPSIIFAIRQNLADAEMPKDGLKVLDQWIGYVSKAKNMVETQAEKDRILALCYRFRADAYYALDDKDLALDSYEKSLALDTTEINTYFNRAALLANDFKDYQRAIDDYKQILVKRPDFGDAYFAIGQIYDTQEQYVNAIEYYTLAVKTNDQRQDYKDNKEVAYMALQRADSTGELSQKLLDLYPDDMDAILFYAQQCYMKENYKKAAEAYTKAIQINPSVLSYTFRGYCYTALQQYDKAIADFSKATEMPSENSGLIFMARGNVYQLANKPDKALADFNEGVRQSPYSPPVFTARGDFYMATGKYKEAVSDFTNAIKLYPYPDYYRKRGEALLKLGKKTEAHKDFEKAEADSN